MVDQSAFQMQGSSGGSVPVYLMKDKTGVVTEVEVPFEQIKPPTPGFFQLKLKGLTKPFEMNGQYGQSRNVRALFVVKGGPEDKRSFSHVLSIAKPDKQGNWRPNITAKSAIGQMIGVIRGKPIEDGEPINLLDYLNGEFSAMVNQTTENTEYDVRVYGNIVKDTWQPAAQQAQPELVAAAVAAPVVASANPFLDDDD